MGPLRSVLSLTVIAFVVLVAVLVGKDNSDAVSLAFFRWRSPELSLFHWVCLALLIGGVSGFALGSGFGLRRRVQARRMQRDLEASQQEVRDLRQIALEE